MNRRSFFRTALQGFIAGAALRYMPETLLAPVPEPEPFTLLEWAQRADPNGNCAKMAEILSMQNDILSDLVMHGTAELPNGQRVTYRPQLPEIYGRSPGSEALELLRYG